MSRFQYKKTTHKPSGFLLSVCVFLAVLTLFIQGLSSLSDSTSVTYCYTVEGAYPESLDYLKDNYGLTYDEDVFYVDYRVIGSNILPDITIIEKGD